MSWMAFGAVPVHLGDGRTLAPGDSISRLDTKNETNRRHIAAGRLVEQKAKAKKSTPKENA